MFKRINANCGILELPNVTLYISYETVVAMKGRKNGCFFEIKRPHISGTTTKHNKLMGCHDFEEVPNNTFTWFLNDIHA